MARLTTTVLLSSFLLLLVISSCTGNADSDKTVSLSEISPTSNKYTETKKETAPDISKNERPQHSLFLGLTDSLYPNAIWHSWDTTLFFDRFGAKLKEKWQVITDKDSLTFQYYTFSDSLRVKNAFFNWLDCFGATCKSYQVGGNIHFKQRTGCILVGEKNVIIIEGNKPLLPQKVVEILEPKKEKQNWLYLVELPKSKAKKAIWYRLNKGEQFPISEL